MQVPRRAAIRPAAILRRRLELHSLSASDREFRRARKRRLHAEESFQHGARIDDRQRDPAAISTGMKKMARFQVFGYSSRCASM